MIPLSQTTGQFHRRREKAYQWFLSDIVYCLHILYQLVLKTGFSTQVQKLEELAPWLKKVYTKEQTVWVEQKA